MSEGTIFPREKCPGGDRIKGDNIYYDTCHGTQYIFSIELLPWPLSKKQSGSGTTIELQYEHPGLGTNS